MQLWLLRVRWWAREFSLIPPLRMQSRISNLRLKSHFPRLHAPWKSQAEEGVCPGEAPHSRFP